MSKGGPTILFVSHEATRTGAPMCLLHLLRWIVQHTVLCPIVLLRRGGDLAAEFQALAPTYYWEEKWVFEGWRRLLPHLRFRRFLYPLLGMSLVRHLCSKGISLIYSNTLTNAGLSDFFTELGCPVITHVHELENSLKELVRPEEVRQLVGHTTHYIACCNTVRQFLMDTLEVSPGAIDVVYEFVSVPEIDATSGVQAREQVHSMLGLPGGARVVLGAGSTDWRKGADLFVQVARSVVLERGMENAHFVWIGGVPQQTEFGRLRYDLRHASLEQRVHFTGAVTNPADFFAAADVFVLTSREDPFPLVILEAAVFGVPTVCFQGAGGAPEFVQTDSGVVVPYLDVNAMADAVEDLLGDDERRAQLGTRATVKVRQRNDVSVGAAEIVSVMMRHC